MSTETKMSVGPQALTRRASKIGLQRQKSETESSILRSLSQGNVPKLHRSLSQGRMHPFDDENTEDDSAAGTLIQQETTQVGSVSVAALLQCFLIGNNTKRKW